MSISDEWNNNKKRSNIAKKKSPTTKCWNNGIKEFYVIRSMCEVFE